MTPATPRPQSSAWTIASTSPSSGASSLDVFYNDGAGNFGAATRRHRSIQLRGEASVELTVESTYTDAGATATDSVDGDLTTRIRVDNPVNTAVVGTYTVTYNVSRQLRQRSQRP